MELSVANRFYPRLPDPTRERPRRGRFPAISKVSMCMYLHCSQSYQVNRGVALQLTSQTSPPVEAPLPENQPLPAPVIDQQNPHSRVTSTEVSIPHDDAADTASSAEQPPLVGHLIVGADIDLGASPEGTCEPGDAQPLTERDIKASELYCASRAGFASPFSNTHASGVSVHPPASALRKRDIQQL
jgi:hypothetical protein